MHMHVRYEGASCSLDVYKGEGQIFSLGTKAECRRKGHAKKLLRIIRKYADKHNMSIELGAAAYHFWPHEGEILEQRELILFYMKNGFKLIQGHIGGTARMRYEPKGKRCSN